MSTYKYISPKPVPNRVFIDNLVKLAENQGNLLYASFPQPPSKGQWGVKLFDRKAQLRVGKKSNRNWYIGNSTFTGLRRRKAEFQAMIAIMIDDPGTKVPFENIILPPTYWVETSPGNYQAWYFLVEPITDRAYAESIVNAMVAQGLAKDGKDPGMKGVTRLCRLPGGWNNKESLDKPHRVTVHKDTRDPKLYTAEEIIKEYELNLEAVANPHSDSIQGDVDQLDVLTAQNDPIYKMFQTEGLIKYVQGNKVEVTCPWVSEHTGETDNGTALLIQPGGGLGFKCHHGHCESKTLEDVHDWLYENCADEYDSHYPPKEQTVEKVNDSEQTIEDAIRELFDQGASESDIAIAIPDIAYEFDLSTYDVQRIVKALKQEYDNTQDLDTIDLSALAKAAETRLSLDKAFPKQLARAIDTKCDSDRLDPIRPVQSLIPTLGSQLGSRTCIVLKPAAHKAEEWREYPLISCIDIGNPSENKSQCNRTVTAPLFEQQKRNHQDYLRARDLYNECCRIARRAGNELPEEPKKPPKLYVTRGTAEGIMKRISELPPRSGMLYVCDELAGLLAGADQYKNGKGNFKNTLLTAMTSPMTGTEERSNSDNGEIIFNDHTLSITGSIQLSRIKHLFDPQYDESGLGSRFLCAYPDLPDDFEIWSETQVNIFGELDGLIQYLQDQGDHESEPIRCTMNRRTQKRFINRYEAFRRIQKTNRDDNPGLAAFIGKCPGHLGRLTLLQHWIACYYGEERPGEITIIAFNRACHLLDYYIGQFRLLQIQLSGPDDLSKAQLYIYNRLKKLESGKALTVSQVYMGLRNSKNIAGQSKPKVREMFAFFSDKGYGNYDPDKGTLFPV
ncbi:hypothetical protein Lepto7375DRAFT_7192 [Leptolyngbya sp. PCC 7375]|nr:hypothetical protein Lepto7375DRAFT_7192 [Leptolyngbya sp. PCC 7375]